MPMVSVANFSALGHSPFIIHIAEGPRPRSAANHRSGHYAPCPHWWWGWWGHWGYDVTRDRFRHYHHHEPAAWRMKLHGETEGRIGGSLLKACWSGNKTVAKLFISALPWWSSAMMLMMMSLTSREERGGWIIHFGFAWMVLALMMLMPMSLLLLLLLLLSLIHIWRCRRGAECRSRWSPYH